MVLAVKGGLVSLENAYQRYNLSLDEFLRWHRQIERHVVQGLRATRVQEYRDRKRLNGSDTVAEVANSTV